MSHQTRHLGSSSTQHEGVEGENQQKLGKAVVSGLCQSQGYVDICLTQLLKEEGRLFA